MPSQMLVRSRIRHRHSLNRYVFSFSLSHNDPRTKLISLIQRVSRKKNPIYHFYEEVQHNHQGKVGNPGDKHYRCWHGNRKVLTITRAMRGSLNGQFDLHQITIDLLLTIIRFNRASSRTFPCNV
jgi:hypothetical protein